MPELITVQRVGVRSRLRFPDGTSIESSQSRLLWGIPIRHDCRVGRSALALRPRSASAPPWVPMVILTEDQFARYRGQSGQLTADLDFQLARTREVAVLPLKPGAVLDDGGSRIEIVNVQRRPEGREVTLRRWRIRSLLSAEWPVQRFFVLRNRARGEALMGGDRLFERQRPGAGKLAGNGASALSAWRC